MFNTGKKHGGCGIDFTCNSPPSLQLKTNERIGLTSISKFNLSRPHPNLGTLMMTSEVVVSDIMSTQVGHKKRYALQQTTKDNH